MSLPFRTKILLAIVGTVVATMGGALLYLDATQAGFIDGQIRDRVRQGREKFKQVQGQLAAGLNHGCETLAKSPRLQSSLLEERLHAEAGGNALYEADYYHLKGDLLLIAAPDAHPIARYPRPAGEPEGHWQKIPPGRMEPKGPYPEMYLVQCVIDGAEAESPFLTDGPRLFQASAAEVVDPSSEKSLGIVVLGSEIAGRVTEEINNVQLPADGAAFLVGSHVAALRFGTGAGFRPDLDLRAAVETALAGRLAGLRPEQTTAFETEIEGHPFHVDAKAVHCERSPEPIYTALLISHRDLTEGRRTMRLALGAAALLAVLAGLLASSALSRGISRPVHELMDGTLRIAQGDYAHRVDIRSRDELGRLGEAFNRMSGDLALKEKIRGVLDKVVAKDVAEELLQGDLGLGGRIVRATLLFADLRGFTHLTQGMPPQAVVGMLNEFMTEMTRAILEQKGIVDKYVGDEIIGVFGAPKSYGDDAEAAVRAAAGMRRKLADLNARRAARGEAPLAMGIGLHTGEVVAGCMGSEEHLNYTCIGATVNLSSRLCSNAKPGQILISEETRRDAGLPPADGRGAPAADGITGAAPAARIAARPLPPIQVKGFDRPIPVYEVVDANA